MGQPVRTDSGSTASPAGSGVAMTDSRGPEAEGHTEHEFYWSAEAEPHSQRRREILAKYGPQVRALYGYDNRTAVQVRSALRSRYGASLWRLRAVAASVGLTKAALETTGWVTLDSGAHRRHHAL